MKMLRFPLIVLGSVCFSAACAGIEESDDIQDGSGPSAASQDVIDGSTDFTGLVFQQQRTLRVRTPNGKTCSATLLLPNVLMTARHCVTTDETIPGPLAPASDVRARILDKPGAPVAPPGVDMCTGPGRDPTCSEGARIDQLDSATDIVFVGLAQPLSLNGNGAMFTPLELTDNITGYVNDDLRVSGWGYNTCSGGLGTLRWGLTTVTDVDGSTTIDGDTYDHLLLKKPKNNQSPYNGDSGGPTWGTSTFPQASLSVASTGKCTVLPDMSSRAGSGAAVPIANHLLDARTLFARAARLVDSTNALTSMTGLQRIDIDATDDAPNWQIVGGHLTQTANAGENVVLVQNEIAHRFLGGKYSVTISSGDNDASGIVFSYVNTTNYMTCAVNAQTHELEASLVRNGTRTVLASQAWNGDFSPAATVSADLTPVRLSGSRLSFPIKCSVSGGGVASASVTAFSDVLPAGRVGIFNDWLDDATYSSFVVDQAPATLPAPPPPPTPEPPPGHMCGSDEKCCEPAAGGGCEKCFPRELTCP